MSMDKRIRVFSQAYIELKEWAREEFKKGNREKAWKLHKLANEMLKLKTDSILKESSNG